MRFIKNERNLQRSDERHINKQLRLAIQDLPDIQRRRFILYHDFGLTYEQIATKERCSKVAVKYVIDKAKTAISEALKVFLD